MAASCENPNLAGSSREVRLSVRGLSKAFHGRPAIEDIDFTASRHEFVAVLGPSGAGKTTLRRWRSGSTTSERRQTAFLFTGYFTPKTKMQDGFRLF